jgi:hypothetical protein
MRRMLIVLTLCCALSGSALAGEMPGVGSSAVGDVPTIGSTAASGTSMPPEPGEMPGVGSTSPFVRTVLLAIVTFLMGR